MEMQNFVGVKGRLSPSPETNKENSVLNHLSFHVSGDYIVGINDANIDQTTGIDNIEHLICPN